MRRLSSVLILCIAALASASASAAPPAMARGEAAGLIIGLRAAPGSEGVAAPAPQGPWAAGRERARAHWESRSLVGRERLTRVARDAGLPAGLVGEAGSAQLLRFERPLRGQALENAVRRARLHPDVAWVEPDVLVPRRQVPNDPSFGQQWHLQAPDAPTHNLAALNLAHAWSITTGQAGVVAVVDSGVQLTHPDLVGKLLPGYDLVSELSVANDGDGRDNDPSDPGDWVQASDLANPLFAGCDVVPSSWHGTFIAGQIAAATNNSLGVAGLNWNAQVLPVRVSGKCGALLSDLLDGLRWAAGLPVTGAPVNQHPARIINLSFGGDAACTPAYQETIDAVTAAGALVVVAAGNEDTQLTRPADCQGVMAVTSVRKDGAKARYASFGGNVALAAPGGSFAPVGSGDPNSAWLLLSTDNGGTDHPGAHIYGHKQGTSFAAPQAAGVASLMLAVNPLLSPRQLMERMKAGVRTHEVLGGLPPCGTAGSGPCNCTLDTCGAGLLDAGTSVQLARGPAVVIKRLAQVEPGTVVTLDGSQSVAISGSNLVSYQWVQVSGPPVTLNSASSATATATLVAQSSYVFSLTVVDSLGRRGEDTVVAVAAMPAPTGGGGGALGLLWGLGLWAWVGAVALRQRRAA